MKHLKSYKIFESNEFNLDVKIYVEDLLLEVSDENIETDVVSISTTNHYVLSYTLSKTIEVDTDDEDYRFNLPFDPKLVINAVESIHSYLTSLGYVLSIANVIDHTIIPQQPNRRQDVFTQSKNFRDFTKKLKGDIDQMVEVSSVYSKLKS
jgi:hypothetical protein